MIFWVGQGNLLVTIGKGLTKTLKNGDEITPDLVKKSEKDEYGLSTVFIEKNTEAGNISENPLAGKVQKNVNIMQNEIVRLRRENEDLKGMISRPAEVKATGKAKEIEESYKIKISEMESSHSEEVERLSSEIESISDYCKKLVEQIEDLGEKPVESDADESKKGFLGKIFGKKP